MDLDDIDPTKVDFELEIKDLTREIVITVGAYDDETFKTLAGVALDLQAAWDKELEDYKKEQAQKKP